MGIALSNPAVLSYCPGILGLDRGIKHAVGPTRTVAFLEIEAFIIENLLAGMEAGLVDAAPIWCNLKTFDARPFRGLVDLITGGYPCQPFSTAGKRGGENDPRHLWPFIRRDIGILRPYACFFENVSGHLSLGFDAVAEDLRNLGYAVEAGLFTAEEVGAPHQRKRLFILAIRKDYFESKLAYSGYFYGREREQKKQSKKYPEEFYRGPELDNANRPQSGDEVPTGRPTREVFGGGSSELANAHGNGSGDSAQYSSGQGKEIKGPEQWTEWDEVQRERVRVQPGHSSSELVHTGCPGLQGSEQYGAFDKGYESFEPYRSAMQSGCDPWPARPGELQHEWEAPRTVEPGMGCTIDGYNFRENLLRALGNAVVEWQASYAFKKLWNRLTGSNVFPWN